MPQHITGAKKINLLPGNSKLQIRSLRYKQPNKQITIAILSTWFVLVFLVFAVSLFFRQSLQNSQKRLRTAQSEYKQYDKVILATSKIRFVAKQVAEVLSTRFEYAKAFAAFGQLFDQSTNISNFELKDNKYFEVGGIASSADAMQKVEQLVDKVNKGNVSEFKWARIKGVTYNQDLSWNFSLEVGL
jgi:hypothetical protein